MSPCNVVGSQEWDILICIYILRTAVTCLIQLWYADLTRDFLWQALGLDLAFPWAECIYVQSWANHVPLQSGTKAGPCSKRAVTSQRPLLPFKQACIAFARLISVLQTRQKLVLKSLCVQLSVLLIWSLVSLPVCTFHFVSLFHHVPFRWFSGELLVMLLLNESI